MSHTLSEHLGHTEPHHIFTRRAYKSHQRAYESHTISTHKGHTEATLYLHTSGILEPYQRAYEGHTISITYGPHHNHTISWHTDPHYIHTEEVYCSHIKEHTGHIITTLYPGILGPHSSHPRVRSHYPHTLGHESHTTSTHLACKSHTRGGWHEGGGAGGHITRHTTRTHTRHMS